MKRAEAIQKNLVKYNTGKPCKNGHNADRYTSSGTCSQCINGSSDPDVHRNLLNEKRKLKILRMEQIVERRKEADAEKIERERRRTVSANAAAARENLIKMKTMCPDRNAGKLRKYAYLLASLRHPALRFADVALPNLTPKPVGHYVSLYTLACDPLDNADIVEYAKHLMKPVQVSRAQILKEAEERHSRLMEMANNADDTFPTGDPR